MDNQPVQTEEDRRVWNFYQSGEHDDDFRNAVRRFDTIIKHIKRTVPRGRVLDVGLGNGYFIDKIRQLGYQAVGLDLSEANIDKLRKRLDSSVELMIGNINRMPFPEASFDCVVVSEILEHLSDVDLHQALDEVRRCLKVGGVVIITVPANENLTASECFCPNCTEVFHRYGHKQSFSKQRLIELIQQHGFNEFQLEKMLDYIQDAPAIEKLKFHVKTWLLSLSFTNRYMESFYQRFLVVANKK
jgi:ubiquinone/menaquinone biosynthesis C-methylase UbiE